VIFKLLLLVVSLPVMATTFQLQTVEQQIGEADGILMGHYLRKKTIRLDDNSLATQMVFKINREYGLQSDQFGMDEVIIHYPGGKLDGITTVVEGVPSFIGGEKVALFIRSVENRYWGMNLALGAFREVNYGKEIMLVNALVPHDPRVGQIHLEDFEKSVKNIKGSNLKTVLAPEPLIVPGTQPSRMPASSSEGKNRSIASKSEKGENEETQPGITTFWLVMVLAFLGGCVRFSRQNKAR
jgi:hypothetical protein